MTTLKDIQEEIIVALSLAQPAWGAIVLAIN